MKQSISPVNMTFLPRNILTDEILTVLAAATEMKVIQQEFSYGSSQLFSDLGGSWGLFLGYSIVNVFFFLERAFLALLAP